MLKCEEVNLHLYQTFEEAQARLQTFLEDVYDANGFTHRWIKYLLMSLS
jgi:hypothetical protein